ncbi:hypothetical protein [Chryseobacterium carnipullorum]|uniref:hypothetical protein n=1 Tax=Chryseobacterium carnipullorum TaxID=1124835 RepID=UPI000E986ACE|nr:hypothetical protein [Chryseobacterium carnipullorum]HBV15030.1 hypothetical protein [Chryseobacterium carnipullorum]
MGLLSNIVWAFNNHHYNDIEDFNKEVAHYQTLILKEKAIWDANQIVINAPEIDICYEAWIKGKEDILSNETVTDEDDIFNEDNSDDGLFQVEFCARLKARNGKQFTALELLFQLENQLANKDLGDHVFFEGLTSNDAEKQKNGAPLYFMYLGS